MRSALLAFVFCLSWSALAFGQAADPGLNAGGLAPPPAVEGQGGSGGSDGAATPQGTDATLAEADREDSGRGLEFVWLNGEVGVQHLGLETFSSKDLLGPDVTRRKVTSVVAGVGLGARIVFLTVGARFRYGYAKDLKHFNVGLEGAVHFPFGALEPYGGLGVGYMRVLDPTPVGLLATNPAASDMKPIAGLDARLFGGVDYYLTNLFSVGANVSGDVLFLFRSGNQGDPANDFYASSGKSIGAGVTVTAVGGLHF